VETICRTTATKIGETGYNMHAHVDAHTYTRIHSLTRSLTHFLCSDADLLDAFDAYVDGGGVDNSIVIKDDDDVKDDANPSMNDMSMNDLDMSMDLDMGDGMHGGDFSFDGEIGAAN
jgi:hypothetical protein